MSNRGVTAVIVSAALSSSIASAQTAEPEQANAEGEIVVTATRRAQSLQDVGYSIQALDSAALERAGTDDFSDYAKGIPSLGFIDRGPGQQQITMRGVNSSTAITNTDQPESKETVAIYFDETPVSLNGFNPDLRLFDVERVEVLRGPQGTLFGGGALSGAIRILTKAPRLGEFEGQAEVLLSTTRRGGTNLGINSLINVPISPAAAVRIVGYVRDVSGFIDNLGLVGVNALPPGGVPQLNTPRLTRDVNTDNTKGVRATLLIEPTPDLSLTARVLYQDTRLGGTQSEDGAGLQVPGDPNQSDNRGIVVGRFQQFREVPEPYFDKFVIPSLVMSYNLGWATLTSATSYQDRDQTNDVEAVDIFGKFGFNEVPALLRNRTRVKDFNQEVRLVSESGGRLDWIAGAYYNRQRKRFDQDYPSPGLQALNPSFDTTAGGVAPVDNGTILRERFDDRQYAVFGEVGYRFGDLRAVAGLRYYNFRQKVSYFANGAFQTFGQVIDVERPVLRDNGFNPRFGLEYTPSKNHLVYANVARGFRLGGTNRPISPVFCPGFTNAPAGFGSDSLWNYEIGSKNQFFDRRVTLNVAGFYVDWSNIPISVVLACGSAFSDNAGRVSSKGLEVDGQVRISQDLRIDFGVGYTDAQFERSFNTLGIFNGQQVPGTPKWTLSTAVNYDRRIKENLSGFAYLGASYRSGIWNIADSRTRIRQPAYTIADVRLGLRTQRWEAALFADNLLDQRAVLFRDPILQEDRISVNRPRTIGINVKSFF
jgi:outer membrane receptor protein involved in Fe transport